MKNTSFKLLFAWPRHRVDLETNRGENNPAIATALNVVGAFTTIVFTVEVLAKLIAESWHPERYFTAPEVSVLLRKSLGGEKVEREGLMRLCSRFRKVGAFNSFDFTTVVGGYALTGQVRISSKHTRKSQISSQVVESYVSDNRLA
jgi:hypothetical protein